MCVSVRRVHSLAAARRSVKVRSVHSFVRSFDSFLPFVRSVVRSFVGSFVRLFAAFVHSFVRFNSFPLVPSFGSFLWFLLSFGSFLPFVRSFVRSLPSFLPSFLWFLRCFGSFLWFLPSFRSFVSLPSFLPSFLWFVPVVPLVAVGLRSSFGSFVVLRLVSRGRKERGREFNFTPLLMILSTNDMYLVHMSTVFRCWHGVAWHGTAWHGMASMQHETCRHDTTTQHDSMIDM